MWSECNWNLTQKEDGKNDGFMRLKTKVQFVVEMAILQVLNPLPSLGKKRGSKTAQVPFWLQSLSLEMSNMSK